MPSSWQQHRQQIGAPRCIPPVACRQRHCQQACASTCRHNASFITCIHTQQARRIADKILSTFAHGHCFFASSRQVPVICSLHACGSSDIQHGQQPLPNVLSRLPPGQGLPWRHRRLPPPRQNAHRGPEAAKSRWRTADTASPGYTNADRNNADQNNFRLNVPGAAAAHASCCTGPPVLQGNTRCPPNRLASSASRRPPTHMLYKGNHRHIPESEHSADIHACAPVAAPFQLAALRQRHALCYPLHRLAQHPNNQKRRTTDAPCAAHGGGC